MADDEREDCELSWNKTLLKLKSKGLEFKLKEQHIKSVKQLYERKGFLAVLPTGFGKSRIFQMLVLMQQNEGFLSIIVKLISREL